MRKKVALRKESVDRNTVYPERDEKMRIVALRKESVDRNGNPLPLHRDERAWIEI